MGYVLQMRPQI